MALSMFDASVPSFLRQSRVSLSFKERLSRHKTRLKKLDRE